MKQQAAGKKTIQSQEMDFSCVTSKPVKEIFYRRQTGRQRWKDKEAETETETETGKERARTTERKKEIIMHSHSNPAQTCRSQR